MNKIFSFILTLSLLMTFFIICNVDAQETVNGSCGSAISKAWSSAPNQDLCASGTPSSVSYLGSSSTLAYNWKWTCQGQNGGESFSCGAQLEDNETVNGSSQKYNNIDLKTISRDELIRLLITLLLSTFNK